MHCTRLSKPSKAKSLYTFNIFPLHGFMGQKLLDAFARSKLGQAPLSQIKPCRFWCCGNHGQLIFQEVHKQPYPAVWQNLFLIRYHRSLGIAGEKNTWKNVKNMIQGEFSTQTRKLLCTHHSRNQSWLKCAIILYSVRTKAYNIHFITSHL